MRSNLASENRSSLAPNDGTSRTVDRWRDVWDADGRTRAIVDLVGTRMTFMYDVQSHTVVQFPAGGRVTLAWCQSQMTCTPATLSQFGANIELRLNSATDSTNPPVGTFLAHPESQWQVADAAKQALDAASKRRRWLDDVVQQANLKLLADLRRGKLVFRGDDPEHFVRWFRGAIRNAVSDAIKFSSRDFRRSRLAPAAENIPDPKAADPAEIVMLLELGRLAVYEIQRIHEPDIRQVMRDLRDEKSTRESASRLDISKAKAGKMRKCGCRLIANRLGK